jgi:hypothetical protein
VVCASVCDCDGGAMSGMCLSVWLWWWCYEWYVPQCVTVVVVVL